MVLGNDLVKHIESALGYDAIDLNTLWILSLIDALALLIIAIVAVIIAIYVYKKGLHALGL